MATYPEAYRDYLFEFHATRDYFECHEVLEAYWKSLPAGDPDREVWVGLIQLAVALYHHRRGNASGALKMYRGAAAKLRPEALDRLGLDGEAVREIAAGSARRLEAEGAGAAYRAVNLPIRDEALLKELKERALRRGLAWGADDPLEDAIVRRHALRDRSDVIEARARAAEERAAARGGRR
ncbi:MAG: hypothetical protein A9Z00_03790 [Thermobacillus sp. ZCTH02-B1]|uniref:DUF309 domain-containing protein n=1 Tax=Thermobacillus sp. ZCTH02-B1 TaxID=1858795 RepID=UPI000B582CDA|nr:DUF309 domain-containing protein [Thermobacillus sp. ZCTH02-B1]OUM96713.1 MAG: hypothetical protein A9Z00_03790 [Thermobacillus sp. ZCTH02-B1]